MSFWSFVLSICYFVKFHIRAFFSWLFWYTAKFYQEVHPADNCILPKTYTEGVLWKLANSITSSVKISRNSYDNFIITRSSQRLREAQSIFLTSQIYCLVPLVNWLNIYLYCTFLYWIFVLHTYDQIKSLQNRIYSLLAKSPEEPICSEIDEIVVHDTYLFFQVHPWKSYKNRLIVYSEYWTKKTRGKQW